MAWHRSCSPVIIKEGDEAKMEMFILGCKYPLSKGKFRSPNGKIKRAAFLRDLRACLLNLGFSIQSALFIGASYLRLADLNIRIYARKLSQNFSAAHS